MGRGQELLDAARKGDERCVEKIIAQITKRSGPFPSIRRGPGVNVQDDNGYTPLHHACVRGHKEIVQLLLSVNASPCVVDKKGATPLHLAAWKGDADVVAMLLAHNSPPCNIDQKTVNSETALLIAAQSGYECIVSQLVARGADVSIQNINQETALDLAAQYGRLETVQTLLLVRPLLVQQYKFPNSRGRVFPSTPLHRASKNGHKDVVAILLSAGFDPNIRTLEGTPLHEAARFGKSSVVRILLAKGADLTAVDGNNKTVYMILADYPAEATRHTRRVIREYESKRNNYESEEDLPPFPIPGSPSDYPGYSVTDSMRASKAPETQKNTNQTESFFSPSSSILTKTPSQSFVKKLASKCLGLKAKFNSAPNISNSSGLEPNVDVKSKLTDHKSSTNTLLIGNSKFFKMLSKKEESGEIVCNDEFDTISLDRLGTLNRDSTVNRSNRSCPGFKTSLPNISENNELSDSRESVAEPVKITNFIENKVGKPVEAINNDPKLNIFEPRKNTNRISTTSDVSLESANFVNECYESYEFMTNSCVLESQDKSERKLSIPRPPPRSNVTILQSDSIYENVVIESNSTGRRPTPAQRTHIPKKISNEIEGKTATYENVSLKRERRAPTPPTRSIQISQNKSLDSSPSVSRSSTLSSDSMIDETNLEDILLSEKSRSFRHSNKITISSKTSKSSIHRTESNDSDSTEASAIENVDCSYDNDSKPIYLSMTGTLPPKKPESPVKKKVLFRHKTFTNIEVDKKYNGRDLPLWNNSVSKDTLAHYHIRGTGHCIYKPPTVQEFIYIFNRETLYSSDVPPFSKVPNNTRDSYFETAICFCKPTPPKHHKSAEDLLNVHPLEPEDKVTIDLDALKDEVKMVSSSFRCFCDSGNCALHSTKRESPNNLVVKFSVVKRSISTPDITLDYSPSSTTPKMGLNKIKSVPSNLEEPYAVVNIIKDPVTNIPQQDNSTDMYVSMSPPSTLSSTDRPYSIKDISDVISLNSSTSTSASANLSCASDSHTALRKSSSSEHSGHWSLKSCYSNVTIMSDTSFKTCIEESSEEDSDDNTLHSDEESSDAETIKSDVSKSKRPWVQSDSFRFGTRNSKESACVIEESVEDSDANTSMNCESGKFESGISVGSVSSSSECEGDSGVPGVDVSLGASLERGSGVVGGVRSGSGRRRWDETEGTSEGDALSISSAASSCAPLHLTHHLEYSKVSPTPPKKPPRRNLSVSPTHANSPSSGYSYELRAHARSQDDLDEIQGSKHYLKHGRSVDQYVDSKLSYSEYEENHSSPRVPPVPNPRPSLGIKNRSQPVAITAMYENVVIKEQNPRRKLRRNFGPQYETFESRMTDRVRKYSHQERSSLESLLDDQSMNSPSDCERYYDGPRVQIPLSPTHYEQPPTPDHPPPSAKQAENSIHERIRPLSQLIMEVVEEIRIRKKSQGDVVNS